MSFVAVPGQRLLDESLGARLTIGNLSADIDTVTVQIDGFVEDQVRIPLTLTPRAQNGTIYINVNSVEMALNLAGVPNQNRAELVDWAIAGISEYIKLWPLLRKSNILYSNYLEETDRGRRFSFRLPSNEQLVLLSPQSEGGERK